MSERKRAVFLDRDGVIVKAIEGDPRKNPRAPFNRSEFSLLPGVQEALSKIREMGLMRILITNQPDVAYGYLTEEEWRWMQDQVGQLPLDAVYICRHTRHDGCECKKPKPGMILNAAKWYDIDLAGSYFVGDTDNDQGAAASAGVGTFILIGKLYNRHVRAEYQAPDVRAAMSIIETIEKGARR